MKKIIWTNSFKHSYKSLTGKQPSLHKSIMKAISFLLQDIFHPFLKTHKLHGDLEGLYACSIDYEHRIIFSIVEDPQSKEKNIILIDIGKHDEVY
jgi:addiction module RelE/StbE family toxin